MPLQKISKNSKKVLKKQCVTKKNIKNIREQKFNQISNDQKNEFKYIHLPKISIKQIETCYAIAINNSNTLCIVAMCSMIKIMEIQELKKELNQNSLEDKALCIQLQILEGIHTDIVSTLNFMEKPENIDSFISGSFDGRIIIWALKKIKEDFVKPKQWFPQFILLGHISYVNCLSLLNDENIISGSSDNTIKLWNLNKLKNDWSCIQTVREHTDIVLGLSINEEKKQLISCGGDKKILIMKLTSNGKLQINQIINVDIRGSRITFITNELFVFLQESSNNLHIYKALRKNIYEKYQEFPVSGGGQSCDFYFPAQYIKQMNLLVLKNGRCVNLIKIVINLNNQNIEIQCNQQQVLTFGKLEISRTYGTLSNNGDLLVTWNSTSNQIQFRILKENIEINHHI
ncbi:unnamed protein product [Paramecium primaurelia]|uniref:Histone acetyltransferase n=1 Tax=Paramecium primaurelia TaxID=5886 RepID=A0A8S1L0Y4_PARPR|nr:unnamed protein product [Paramecium primaurelia]